MICKWFSMFTLIALICFFRNVSAISVMSVDLGNEFMKIAIVSPGKPMEIVLNTDSMRKTPLIVAFRDGERFFGEAAVTTASRFPEKAFSSLLDLIGKTIDSPAVRLYRKRHPYHNITGDAHQIYLTHPEGLVFTPEELLAMILEKNKLYAETAAGQKITEAVITVPPYFTQAERRGILLAAELASLKVLQLINTHSALALNYGIFRRKDFNESNAFNVLFYDMGSSATIAVIASFQMIKTKERGFTETHPQLTIKGIGFDRTLGGLEMQFRLRDHLAKLFAEQRNKQLEKITNNKRAMSKLLKEAGRLKKVLSANTEHLAQVENVLDNEDLKVLVTREDFENLCKDLFETRVTQPITTALEAAGMTINDLDQIIPFGGNTRVPKVQEILTNYIGDSKTLSRNVDADDAAALGAAYQAAYLSKGFKVKTFLVKDINIYPIQVSFTRLVDENNTGKLEKKLVHRTLFTRNNIYPQKKLMTFNRHTEDFDINVNYGDLTGFLNEIEREYIKPLNVSKVDLKSVKETLEKHSDKESKGIKAHFRLDESGLLRIDSVEAVFEYKVEETIEDDSKGSGSVVGDAFAKFGNTISKLFGGEGDAGNDTLANATEPNNTEQVNNEEAATQLNKTVDNSTEANENTNKTRKEIKIKVHKEKITITHQYLDVPSLSTDEFKQSVNKLKELNDKDIEKLARDHSLNNLESFITETKMKLYEKEYEEASTDADREKLLQHLNEASEWLENDLNSIETSKLEGKFTELSGHFKELFNRVKEHRERPEAIKSLRDMLNISKIFMTGALNLSATTNTKIFTENEIKTLTTLIEGTEKWLEDNLEQQKKISLAENPKFTIKQIAEKLHQLDREVKYLINIAQKMQLNQQKKESEKTENKTNEDKEKPTEEDKKTESPDDQVKIEDEEETKTDSETKKDTDVPNKEDPHVEL